MRTGLTFAVLACFVALACAKSDESRPGAKPAGTAEASAPAELDGGVIGLPIPQQFPRVRRDGGSDATP